jgi:transposase
MTCDTRQTCHPERLSLFGVIRFLYGYKRGMSEREAGAVAGAAGALRLRKPERRQMEWVAQCSDDLVSLAHPVRTVAAVVAKLDVSAFGEAIQARDGVAGRDATDPELLVALWLYGCIRGIGSARELARRCEESLPFRWLCGGVSVNHRMLSEFRTAQGAALDELFTQVIASLVDQELVSVSRISQDGVRVRVSAGAASFRRGERLEQLLSESRQHVEALKRQVEEPEKLAAVVARKKAAQRRAAEEKQKRVEQALAQLPELKQRREQRAERAGQGRYGDQIRAQAVRASTSDAQARVMRMPNGGYHPAFNVQLAADVPSRAIVGVEVSNEGYDSAGLSEPMREQVERRSGKKVRQHLLDGGYLRHVDLERAQQQGVELFLPPKGARLPENRGRELQPKSQDSEALRAWKQRMASDEGQKIYRQRAATSETVNADLRSYRGLTQFTVRGVYKARCVALWCALAYNVMHFSAALLR